MKVTENIHQNRPKKCLSCCYRAQRVQNSTRSYYTLAYYTTKLNGSQINIIIVEELNEKASSSTFFYHSITQLPWEANNDLELRQNQSIYVKMSESDDGVGGLSYTDSVDRISMFVFSLISIFGCCFMFFSVYKFKKLRTLTFELLMQQTFADFLYSLCHVIFFQPAVNDSSWLVNNSSYVSTCCYVKSTACTCHLLSLGASSRAGWLTSRSYPQCSSPVLLRATCYWSWKESLATNLLERCLLNFGRYSICHR